MREMLSRRNGPDQRSLVIQLLRAERIPLGEAETIIALLENDERADRSAAAPLHGEASSLGFDLGVVADRIREGLSGIENAVRQTMYAVDVRGAIDQALSHTQSSSEGRQSYDLEGGEHQLRISNPWGDVVLRGVDGLAELRIAYRVAALAPQQRLAEYNAAFTRIAVERDGDCLKILATPPGDASMRSIKIDVAVELPPHLGASAKSLCGDFTAAELHGNVHFSGRIGDIVLQRLHGTISARTTFGDVSAFVYPEQRAALNVLDDTRNVRIEVPAGKPRHVTRALHTTLYDKAESSGTSLSIGTGSGNVRVAAGGGSRS